MADSKVFSQQETIDKPNQSLNLFAPCIGVIAQVKDDGDILVKFADYPLTSAKLVSSTKREELQNQVGREVLLVFNNGDATKPIITNLMENRLEELVAFNVEQPAEESSDKNNELREFLVDGKRITIEAQDEIELKCGKGSITISKDGKIVIRGTHLVSRSSGVNKIKGGAVRIN